MHNLKNLHLIWIITLMSAATVVSCLAFLFAERSNATSIAQVTKDLDASQKSVAAEISLIKGDAQAVRHDVGLIRIDLTRVDKDLDETSATLKKKPWDPDLQVLKKQLDETTATLKKKPWDSDLQVLRKQLDEIAALKKQIDELTAKLQKLKEAK